MLASSPCAAPGAPSHSIVTLTVAAGFLRVSAAVRASIPIHDFAGACLGV
jgi:hypothetical protein